MRTMFEGSFWKFALRFRVIVQRPQNWVNPGEVAKREDHVTFSESLSC